LYAVGCLLAPTKKFPEVGLFFLDSCFRRNETVGSLPRPSRRISQDGTPLLGESTKGNPFGSSSLRRLFRSVSASGLFSAFHASTIQGPSNHLIPNAGQVPDTAPSDQDNGVFLQVMAFAGDIDGNFFAVGKPHSGDFSQGGVRLFGRHRTDLEANPPFLGAALQRQRFAPTPLHHPGPTNQLIDRWHLPESFSWKKNYVIGVETFYHKEKKPFVKGRSFLWKAKILVPVSLEIQGASRGVFGAGIVGERKSLI